MRILKYKPMFDWEPPIPFKGDIFYPNSNPSLNYDIVFVPGVLFDKNMYRLGLGSGVYDKYLQHFNGIKIGVVYSMKSIVDNLYPDIHDIPMDAIYIKDHALCYTKLFLSYKLSPVLQLL